MHLTTLSAITTFELEFFYFVDWPLTPNWAAVFISRVTSYKKRELPLALASPRPAPVTSCSVSVILSCLSRYIVACLLLSPPKLYIMSAALQILVHIM